MAVLSKAVCGQVREYMALGITARIVVLRDAGGLGIVVILL